MSKYSRVFIRKSSGVGTWSSDRVKCVASLVFNSVLFTPSINFEAIAKFRSDILSSGLLLFLSNQGRPKSCLWIRHLFDASSRTKPWPDALVLQSRIDSAGCEKSCERCLVHWPFSLLHNSGRYPPGCLSVRCIPVSLRDSLLQSATSSPLSK